MVASSFFAVFLLIVAICIKTKAVKPGSVFMGLALGLMMASTAVGPPILIGMNSLYEGFITAISSLGG